MESKNLNENEKYSLIDQENIIESILFMMGESVSIATLAVAIESTIDVAKEAADRLYNKYQNEYSNRGMKVIKLENKYQMVSNNKYFKNLVLVASHPQKPVITESILETLSIIAYKQPISKPEIENIRGVKSDYACNRLLEYGLIEEKGRLETPGRPIIFGTTEEFMLRFGIESLDDLPMLDATRFAEIEKEVEKELTESLGEPVIIDKDKYVNDVTKNLQLNKNVANTNNENIENVDSEKDKLSENNNEPVMPEIVIGKIDDFNDDEERGFIENDTNAFDHEIVIEKLNKEENNRDCIINDDGSIDESVSENENLVNKDKYNYVNVTSSDNFENNKFSKDENIKNNKNDSFNKSTLEGEGPQ